MLPTFCPPMIWAISLEFFAGILRGNSVTVRGNRARNSERKMALCEGLWDCIWKTSENPLKPSENLWKPSKTLWKALKPSLSETPSEADFPLRTSQACCPYSCCPLIFLQILWETSNLEADDFLGACYRKVLPKSYGLPHSIRRGQK